LSFRREPDIPVLLQVAIVLAFIAYSVLMARFSTGPQIGKLYRKAQLTRIQAEYDQENQAGRLQAYEEVRRLCPNSLFGVV
jgi:hypothetical protein